jgi:hypothetical protein
MAGPCKYRFTDKNGNEVELGLSAFKAYLADGGLEQFYPAKDFPWQAQFSRPAALPEKINIDGKERWTVNSSGRPIASTEEAVRNFWNWFTDSQVVDDQGRPIVVYHGTTHDFSKFDIGQAGQKDSGWYGTGIYVTPDANTASAYADYDQEATGQNVIPMYAKIENPFIWSRDIKPSGSKPISDDFTRLFKNAGHDGVFAENKYAAPEHQKWYEMVVFHPENLKAAYGNNGNFSAEDTDIRYSRNANTSGERISEADAAQHLKDNFGVGIDNLIRQKVLNFTHGKATWPENARNAARGDEEAVYTNGKAYIDLDATGKGRLNAVVLHELGEHYGLQRMLGEQAYKSLQQQVIARAKIPGSKAAAVWASVKADYGHLEEGSPKFVAEVIAKLGENDPKAPWFRRLLSQIKAFLMRMGLARGLTAGTVTESDLHDLLRASLQRAARGYVKDDVQVFGGNPQPAFSALKSSASWTAERIDSLFGNFAYTMDDDKTKAFAGFVSPEEFLDATTTPTLLAQIESESRPLSVEDMRDERQPIILFGDYDGTTFTTDGHEGRHRMVALRDSGVKKVPVVFHIGQGKKLFAVSNVNVTGQYISGSAKSGGEVYGRGFKLPEAIPINYANKARVEAFFGVDSDAQFSRPSLEAVKQRILRNDQGDPTLTAQAIRKLEEKWGAVTKQRFAALSVRQMVEYAKRIMPGLESYQIHMQQREATVNSILRVADRLVSEVWKKLPLRVQKDLAAVMHGSTIADIDASKAWTGTFKNAADTGQVMGFNAYTQEAFTPGRKAALLKLAIDNGALKQHDDKEGTDDPTLYLDRNGYLFKTEAQAKAFVLRIQEMIDAQRKDRSRIGAPDENINRQNEHARIVPLYEALDPKAQYVYAESNRLHNDISSRRLEVLLERIGSAIANGQKRKQLIAQMRAQFESNSLNWYYAPLSRFGEFWFYGKDKDGQKRFSTYESDKARNEAVKNYVAAGNELVGQGKSMSGLSLLEGKAPSDDFVLKIQEMISGISDMPQESKVKIQDQIYQMYLETLPDVSVRHNRMHRNDTLGFEEDAMRSFSNSQHHGATQLANMLHGGDMKAVLEKHIEAKKLAERPDTQQYLDTENEAAELLKDRWDELTPEALRDMLAGFEEPAADDKVLRKAQELRSKLYGMNADEAGDALDRIVIANEELTTAAKLIKKEDINRASDVLDELLKTYDFMVNYNSTEMDKVASSINQMNFIGMLGFSLSSGLVNLIQTPGVAMPVASGRYGVGATLREFGKAYREFMKAFSQKKYDVDGNASISALLQEQLDALKARPNSSANEAEIQRIDEEIWAMEKFKEFGDISRTRTSDIMGVAQEGATYGGKFHDFALKAGWMFHHGERFNREVTLMASFRMALQGNAELGVPPLGKEAALDYARNVNNRSHLDYTSENAARIFRGPLAKIALQFKKYQQGMLYLWTRTAIDAWSTVKEENFDTKAAYEFAVAEMRESRRTFFALLAMQASTAGMFGLPMMGMVGVAYKMIAQAFGDDDDPHELEKDLRLGLGKLFGQTAAEAMSKGVVNTFTPINLASRLDQKDVFFHEPMKELEGRDAGQNYVAALFGPTGGTVEKVFQGMSYLSDGYYGRFLESIMPKAVGDIAKAARFSAEGAKTLDNMPLKDMSAFESFAQAMGFGSSGLERKYAERGFAKGEEAAIKDTRTKVMREAAWAKVKGEQPDMQAIRDWNMKHPEKKILPEHLSASVKGIKESVKKRQERGYVVDPKLEYLYEENDLPE